MSRMVAAGVTALAAEAAAGASVCRVRVAAHCSGEQLVGSLRVPLCRAWSRQRRRCVSWRYVSRQ